MPETTVYKNYLRTKDNGNVYIIPFSSVLRLAKLENRLTLVLLDGEHSISFTDTDGIDLIVKAFTDYLELDKKED